MSKPTTRYVITPSEWADACTYLQRKFALHAEWLDNPDAPRSFREHARDPATLSHWCQHWLSSTQWLQLKAALRAARHRRRQHTRDPGPDIHIRLEREAAWVLTELAKREGITRSEFILRHHRQDWLALVDPDEDVECSQRLTATARSE